jgi:hypothetical protein
VATRAAMLRLLRGGDVDTFMAAPRSITSSAAFQNLEPGVLVAFLDRHHIPHHVVVNIGNGWFAGAGNGRVRASLGSEPSLITAEEFGSFGSDGTLDGVWTIKASPSKWSTAPRVVPPVSPDISRVQGLLGVDLGFFSAVDGRVVVKAHGAAFNVNRMDASELRHVIEGQIEAAGMNAPLQSVRLISCYSAVDVLGRQISTGQTLADFLDVPVEAYFRNVNDVTAKMPQANNPAGMKVFRPRLKDWDNAHLNPSPRELVQRTALENQVLSDRQRHAFWHEMSEKFASRLSLLLNAIHRQRRSADTVAPVTLERLLQAITTFALGDISATELMQKTGAPVDMTAQEAFEDLRPEWLALAGEP